MIELLIPVKELQSVVELIESLEKGFPGSLSVNQKHFLKRCKAELSDYQFIVDNILPNDDKKAE